MKPAAPVVGDLPPGGVSSLSPLKPEEQAHPRLFGSAKRPSPGRGEIPVRDTGDRARRRHLRVGQVDPPALSGEADLRPGRGRDLRVAASDRRAVTAPLSPVPRGPWRDLEVRGLQLRQPRGVALRQVLLGVARRGGVAMASPSRRGRARSSSSTASR